MAMLMLPLLLILAGCVKFDAAFKISADDRVDINLLLAVQQQYSSLVREACTPSSTNNLPAGTITSYSQDGFVGCTLKASGVPLNQAFKDNSTYVITHENGQYTFWMKNTNTGTSSDASSGTDSTAMTSAMFTTFKIAVTFPGEVTSHSGSSTVEGTTVTWTNPDDALTGDGLKATSKEANPLLLALPWVIGLVGLLLVGGVGLAVWSRVRSRPSVKHITAPVVPDAAYPTPNQATNSTPYQAANPDTRSAPVQPPEAAGAPNPS